MDSLKKLKKKLPPFKGSLIFIDTDVFVERDRIRRNRYSPGRPAILEQDAQFINPLRGNSKIELSLITFFESVLVNNQVIKVRPGVI